MQYPIADLSLAARLQQAPLAPVRSMARSSATPNGRAKSNSASSNRVTAALEAADQPGAHFTARIAAMHRNRELWLTLTSDLAGRRQQAAEIATGPPYRSGHLGHQRDPAV